MQKPMRMNDIDKVIAIAREAGEILKRCYQEQKYTVATKTAPDDYVTSADLASDAHIRKRLTELFSADPIFSEEDTNRPTDFSGRVWFVDPLDGTASFVAREENFTVLIGLCENGKPVLGVVCDPMTNEVYFAEKNKGAWAIRGTQKYRLRVSTRLTVADARMCVSSKPSPHFFKHLVDSLSCKEELMRGDGMAGKVFCLLAQGDAECRINVKVAKWDTCGPQIILEEAGGKVTDIDGNLLDYTQKEAAWQRLVVATNGGIHAEVLAHMQKEIH